MSNAEDLIFGDLNDLQREAVLATEGPELILAGAGSGKTRTLTHRIAYLIARGVMPWNILAVTFTNKAANEMKSRIATLLKLTDDHGSDHQHLPVSGTFHSLCVRMLRRDIEKLGRDRNFVIYDEDDREKMMQATLRELKILPEDLKPRAAIAQISRFKSEALGVHAVRSQTTTFQGERMAEVYARYEANMRSCNALDFDDLILETVRMLSECPDVLARYQQNWKYLHIDEYQDTNHAQYLLVSLLAKAHRNLCVIGDPDQSIYAFRGADIRNILEFRNEYHDARIIKLEQNYRSTQPILDAADSVIKENPNRPEKKMWTLRKDGTRVTLHALSDEKREAEEAVRVVQQHSKDGVGYGQQVVLYRTNAQSRLLEEACMRNSVPYRILGGVKFYARKEVKDILAYLFTIVNPSDTISLLRIINVPSRKIGQTTILKLQAYCNERGISLWQGLKHIEMVEGLNDPTKRRLAAFAALVEKYQSLKTTVVVGDLSRQIIDEIGLEKDLRDGTDEGESRWENVLELLSVMRKYDGLEPEISLTSFLEEAALISEVDKLNDTRVDALTLMTLHLCKGLEFSTVIMVGCEEGIFPHAAAQFDRDQLEEERRLMYVGMTRAKNNLHLMHAMQRMLWGKTQDNDRSRFIDDIPAALLDVKSDNMMSKFAWLTSSNARPKNRSRMQNDGMNQDTGGDVASQDAGWNDDVLIDAGTRIVHAKFGTGTVVERSGDVIEIAFDTGMKRKLALSIAPLKVLEIVESEISN